MTREKLFRRDYAQVLWKIAEGDIQSAEVMALHLEKGRRENICFAAQQCIKKALKAVLCAREKAVPMTHSIELILDRLQTVTPVHPDALIELTDFATSRRYEEGNEIITAEDVQAIIAAGRSILEWAKNEIAKAVQ